MRISDEIFRELTRYTDKLVAALEDPIVRDECINRIGVHCFKWNIKSILGSIGISATYPRYSRIHLLNSLLDQLACTMGKTNFDPNNNIDRSLFINNLMLIKELLTINFEPDRQFPGCAHMALDIHDTDVDITKKLFDDIRQQNFRHDYKCKYNKGTEQYTEEEYNAIRESKRIGDFSFVGGPVYGYGEGIYICPECGKFVLIGEWIS
jgi:hypothetical protein